MYTHTQRLSSEQKHVLSNGTLRLSIEPDSLPNLFKIAERKNPKRAFLFVSTVLGRHIPVRPNQHRAILTQLAGRVLQRLQDDNPVLVIGFAETAVGLGAGVFDSLCRMTWRKDICFLQTTRHPVEGHPIWTTIEEGHSHATTHFLHKPDFIDTCCEKKITIVLVDDEATTGATFKALATGLLDAGLQIGQVILVSLTDWSAGAAPDLLKQELPNADIASVSLLNGHYTWQKDEEQPIHQLPASIVVSTPEWSPVSKPSSLRLGVMAGERHVMAGHMPLLVKHVTPGDRVLVIGTGEYVWQPFLAAEILATCGYNTSFIATTRSPINMGGAIERKITFDDHFGIGVEMYVHNVNPDDFERIFIFTETSAAGICSRLRAALPNAVIVSSDGIELPSVSEVAA